MREGTGIYTRPEERQGAKDDPGEYTDLANNQGLRCKKVTQTHMLEFRWVRKTWLTHVIKFPSVLYTREGARDKTASYYTTLHEAPR